MENEHIEETRETAHATTERLSRAAHERIDRVARQGERAEEYIRDAGRRAGERTREVSDTMVDYVREHPLAAVGTALAVGMMLASLLRRR